MESKKIYCRLKQPWGGFEAGHCLDIGEPKASWLISQGIASGIPRPAETATAAPDIRSKPSPPIPENKNDEDAPGLTNSAGPIPTAKGADNAKTPADGAAKAGKTKKVRKAKSKK